MSRKSTPGPWIVERPTDGRSPVRITSAGPLMEGATQPVEIARVTKIRGMCGDYAANADLLAAAPVLAEALRQLLKVQMDQQAQLIGTAHDDDKGTGMAALNALRAAGVELYTDEEAAALQEGK